ncbi:hypothetical protein Mycsm_06575 (plasmid) [Mycobacterium sp. JS623]|nr:hypothetical protein Mycsm_06575 [Mycobacterium sp. JS623]
MPVFATRLRPNGGLVDPLVALFSGVGQVASQAGADLPLQPAMHASKSAMEAWLESDAPQSHWAKTALRGCV